MSLTLFGINFVQAFFFAIFGFLGLGYISKKTKFKTLTTKLPTAYGIPFFGISYKFLPMKKFLYEVGKNFETLKCSTYLTWFGMNPFVISVDPDFVKAVLTSDEFLLKARTIYSSIENALPNGLMTRNGSEWRNHRKLMNFSFSQSALKGLLPIFNKTGQNMVEQFEALIQCHSNEHDIFGLIKRNIFQTAIGTTMGVELKDGNEIDDRLANGFNYVLHEVAREMVYNSVNLGFLCHSPKYKRTLQFLRKYAENLFNTQCASNAANDLDKNDERQNAIFLQKAISYYERGLFELDDVITETHTLIAGAFDTVTTTIYSLIVVLAMHPEIQNRLYSEICSAIPTTKNDNEIDYEETKLVPYMDMVIDETLRLMPSIPLIGRQTSQDIEISAGLVLPKDMQVAIPIFSLHRRKDIWGPNADAFDPDNFLPERVSQRHPYAYIPFSKGGRACLGLRYANVAVRVLLLRLMRNFKFSTTFKYEDLVFIDYVSLRYDVEPKIKIERRTS